MTLQFDLAAACKHLSAADPVMARLVETLPPMQIEPRAQPSSFAALLRAIVGQQLSVKAAATIHGRVVDLFESGHPEAKALLALDIEQLRAAGLSGNKVRAVCDLAEKCLDGTVPALDEFERFDSDEIVERLVQVRGIGRWTAQMLLIFQLGRPDVLPVDDLGVRRGYQRAYAKKDLPGTRELADYGERWAPYRSLASWYLWRASEAA